MCYVFRPLAELLLKRFVVRKSARTRGRNGIFSPDIFSFFLLLSRSEKRKGIHISSSPSTFYFYYFTCVAFRYISQPRYRRFRRFAIFFTVDTPLKREREHRKIISGWTLNFPRPGRSIIPAAVVTWRRALEIGNNRGQRNGIIYGNNRKYPAPARGCSIVVPAGRKWLVRAERISRQLLFHGCLQARVFLFVVPFSTRENRPIVSHYTRCLPRPCSFVVIRFRFSETTRARWEL